MFLDKDRPKSNYVRVNTYWHAVGKIASEGGVLKYPQLFALAKAVFSLSHGNEVPERGFSINKYALSNSISKYQIQYQILGNLIIEDTIVALRLVKDEPCSVGGFSNFKITKSLLQSVKGSYACYQAYLEAEMKVKVDQEWKKKEQEKEEKVEKEKTKSKLNQNISFTKDCIK